MGAIFDLPLTPISDNLQTSNTELLDSGNDGVAFRISLVMVAISNSPLTSMLDSVHTSPTELLDPEIVGVVFGISLLSGIEAQILHYFICTSGDGGHF